MKAKTRNLLIGTAIAAAVGATGGAIADMGGYGAGCAQMQQGQGGHGMMGGMMKGHGMQGGMMGQGSGSMMGQGMMGGMGQGLDLSDEQRAEMGKIRQQFLPKMGELRGRMQANHEQLRAMFHGGVMDETSIATLADQKGDLMAEMIKLRAAHRARMQGMLTDEQLEQMRQRRQGMGMGMGMDGMRMDGGMMGAPQTDS